MDTTTTTTFLTGLSTATDYTITNDATTTTSIIANLSSNGILTTHDYSSFSSANCFYNNAQPKEYHLSSNKLIYNEYLKLSIPLITKVEVLKPNKVMRFTFSDDTKIKTICTEADDFDFNFAFYLAYAKLLYKNILNPLGIEKKAKEFMDVVSFNSLVKKGIKVYKEQEKEKEKLEKEKAESKAIQERRIAKKIAKKARAKEARIEEMAAAIKKAKNDEWITTTTIGK